jgi:hypothetical protein
MAVRIRHADHVTLTSPTSGGRSVGIVRLRTEATESSFSFFCYDPLSTFLTHCGKPNSIKLSLIYL